MVMAASGTVIWTFYLDIIRGGVRVTVPKEELDMERLRTTTLYGQQDCVADLNSPEIYTASKLKYNQMITVYWFSINRYCTSRNLLQLSTFWRQASCGYQNHRRYAQFRFRNAKIIGPIQSERMRRVIQWCGDQIFAVRRENTVNSNSVSLVSNTVVMGNKAALPWVVRSWKI